MGYNLDILDNRSGIPYNTIMDKVCPNTFQKMVRSRAQLTGEEIWLCPGCGKRGETANKPGDACLVEALAAQVAFDLDERFPVASQPLQEEQVKLAPWLKWIHQVDFDNLGHPDHAKTPPALP